MSSNTEIDMAVKRTVRLALRISEMLKSKPDSYIFEQLLREQHFLFGLINGLRNDNVANRLDETEEFLNEIKIVRRPTSHDEIQAGWEVRSRNQDGYETAWGTAHRQDASGDWVTETNSPLTWDSMCWTYETTTPKPQ